jgi:hypothetical protein
MLFGDRVTMPCNSNRLILLGKVQVYKNTELARNIYIIYSKPTSCNPAFGGHLPDYASVDTEREKERKRESARERKKEREREG